MVIELVLLCLGGWAVWRYGGLLALQKVAFVFAGISACLALWALSIMNSIPVRDIPVGTEGEALAMALVLFLVGTGAFLFWLLVGGAIVLIRWYQAR